MSKPIHGVPVSVGCLGQGSLYPRLADSGKVKVTLVFDVLRFLRSAAVPLPTFG